MTTRYITKATVLAIHAHSIKNFGGIEGVRDEGLLEAAIFRPQTGYYYDIIEEAAALWESLSQNHPFLVRRALRLSGSEQCSAQSNARRSLDFCDGTLRNQ